ncbi:MAG: DUF58 domain-containing protein [Candidatus Pacearchaeota archaeon]
MENKVLQIDYKKESVAFEKILKKFQLKKIIYRTLFKGKGLEFDGYRFFLPDDDYYQIDWKASLRVGKKMIKQYREERDVSVFFLVDCSSSVLFGSGDLLKAEYIGKIVCVLSDLVVNSGDKASLIMFSDKLVRFVPPSSKKEQVLIFHKFLSDLNNYGGEFDLERLLNYLASIVGFSSSNSFVLISDFLYLKRGFEKIIPSLLKKGDFFSIMVRDKFDEILPKESTKVFVKDPFSNRKMFVDLSLARGEFYRFAKEQKERVKKLFNSNNIDLFELKNEEDFVLPLSQFMKRRAEEVRI